MADKFAIWNGTGNTSSGSAVAPFIVDSGVVYMDMARIKDGAIQTAKIGDAVIETALIDDLAVTTGKIGNLAVTTAKIYDLSVTTAKIGNAAITSAKIDVAQINIGHITNLYAHKLSGDISKPDAASLASSVDFANASNTFENLITLGLPKPSHTGGWLPYATFNLNRVEVEKNSWYHIILEMAPWNVNTTGGTGTETASTNASPTAYGTTYNASSINATYWAGTPAAVGSPVVTYIEVARTEFSTSPTTSDTITDGSNTRPITSITTTTGTYRLNFSVPTSWTTSTALTIYTAVASGAIGTYGQVARIRWVAVDTGYNDFTISGTWLGGNTNILHGIKVRCKISGDANIIGSSNATDTMTVHEATGFMMGVR